MYKVDPVSYFGVFVMPAAVADRHLKLASEPTLKTVLYIYRHADSLISAADVSAGTGLTETEAADALEYWRAAGFLRDETEPAEKKESPEKKSVPENEPSGKPEEPAKPVIKQKPGRLTYQQICSRIEESSIVRELFREAQEKLGRTIGTADQSALLNLHDFYGLPIEVILAICEYANTHGKANNINYIFTVGADWSVREIDTIEAADEEFRRLEQIGAIWPEFKKMTGITTAHPTAAQHKYLSVWTDEWKFSLPMLAAAFEEMSRHTESVSFPYMNKILAGWHSSGVKTPEEAGELQRKFALEKEQKQQKKAAKTASPYGVRAASEAPERPASYDIQKATQRMNTTVPVHKKKEKR